MSKKKATVYSYARFSSGKQAEGTSLERQIAMAKEWCDKKGLRLADDRMYEDKACSAFRGKNAEEGKLGLFLQLVQTGKIERGSILLVESLDRISRNTINRAAQIFLSIINSGIKIVTLCDNAEFDETHCDLGQLIMSLCYFARSNDESRMKSIRKAKSWEFKRRSASEGKPHGGKTPVWIKLVGNRDDGWKYELVPAEVKKIQAIFRDYVNGAGIYTINKTTGIPKATLAYWLNNPVVIGTLKVTEDGHPLEIPNHYPAIIDNGTWRQAQAKKAQRFIVRRAGKTGQVNLFAGKLFDHKGERLDVANHYGFTSYVSPNGVCIQARYLEQVVCFEKLNHHFVVTKYVEQKGTDPRLLAIDAKIANVQKEMTDADIVAELIPVLRELKRQRKEIEANQKNTVTESVDFSLIKSLMTDPNDIDARRRLREIVRETIDTITIDRVDSDGGWYMMVNGKITLREGETIPFRYAYCTRRIGYIMTDGFSGISQKDIKTLRGYFPHPMKSETVTAKLKVELNKLPWRKQVDIMNPQLATLKWEHEVRDFASAV